METPEKLACVTGASGFIGSHVVAELLKRGYRVRATVRDADDDFKTTHLRALAPKDDPERLELHSANLLDDGAFDDIIAGCQTVYHVASAVMLAAKDAQREIVDPAVIGTRNVFSAIAKAKTVTGVGLTSSIAAVLSIKPRPGHRYTEEDWAEDATVGDSPYPLAKREAEKAAWAAREAMPESEQYELVVVNPVVVTGPVLAKVHVRSSPAIVRSLMLGDYKGCPNLCFGLVDVRDVVEAMVGGVEAGGKTGRYLLHSETLWMQEMAHAIEAEFPDRTILTRKLPNFVMYIAAMFDPRLTWSFLRRNLGKRSEIDQSKVERELGITLRDARRSLLDTCHSFIDQGFL
jgi:nucleoside-diphosphate-sugar epimerase